MNKFFGMLTLALGISALVTAQDKNTVTAGNTPLKETVNDEIIKPSRDFFMLQLTYDNWNQTPDNIKVGGIGRGVNAYLCYDFPISKSHFSFAAGLGVSSSNIYFKDQVAVMNTEVDTIAFVNVDTAGANLYKRSKLNTTYLEAPFELRFFGNKLNRNRGFKAALGMRVGVLIGAHSKVRRSVSNTVITEKVNTKRYVQTWRFAPTFRIGWGNFSLYGSYNLSPLFKAGQGPEVFPYSVGICISGL